MTRDERDLPLGANLIIAAQPNPRMAKALAEAYSQVEVPEPLRRPLVFGDVAQVDALRRYEREITAYVCDEDPEGEPMLRRFEVTIHAWGSKTIEITAMNAQEAEEYAMERGDELEIEVEEVRFIGPADE